MKDHMKMGNIRAHAYPENMNREGEVKWKIRFQNKTISNQYEDQLYKRHEPKTPKYSKLAAWELAEQLNTEHRIP